MQRDYEKELQAYLEREKTLAYMMLQRADTFGDQPALIYRENGSWHTLSWSDFGERITSAAKALLAMSIAPGDMIAIFSQNRPEWAFCDLAILAARAVSVPVYATNSAEETEYIVRDAGVKMIFVGDQDQYDRSYTVLERTKGLEKIIAFDRKINIRGEQSMYLDELLEAGRKADNSTELEQRLASVQSDDMLTLIYTSGTTGSPKGAVYTHEGFMAGIFPSVTRFEDVVRPGLISLAILPLSHVFERMWSYGCMSMGIQIAYCPDPKEFVEVMNDIRPHFLTSVPRIWEKVYGTIQQGIKNASPGRAKLFHWAADTAVAHYRTRKSGKNPGIGLALKHALADALVCKKVREKLGARRNYVYHVGGGAFAPEINEFFQAFGINIIQGYGLTEFFPVCVGFNDHGKVGACGPVLPLVQVRISSEGEIQLKGRNVMQGYFKKPEATREMFTADGWFKTEDVGHLEGQDLQYITITDRIKDLIVTAGGKNISPQQIELLLGDEPFIEQVVVVGEGKKYITALIVPDFAVLEDYARSNNIPFQSRQDLIEHPDIISLYEKQVADRTTSLGRVEQIKKIKLLDKELTQEGGELTPTLKVKRKAVSRNYSDLIEQMYQEG